MAKQKLTQHRFATFLYLMETIFPESSSVNKISNIKNDLEEYYFKYYGKSTYFRKSINRIADLVKDIRNNTLNDNYFPDDKTLNVFVSYCSEKPSEPNTLDFKTFAKKYESEIEAFYEEHTPSQVVLQIYFPEPHEKLKGIESRIDKLEKFLKSKDAMLDELFQKNKSYQSITQAFGNEKVALGFLHYLQEELIETRKKYKQAKKLYGALGSFGLFFIPVKYALFEEQEIVDDFLESTLLDDGDVLEDLV